MSITTQSTNYDRVYRSRHGDVIMLPDSPVEVETHAICVPNEGMLELIHFLPPCGSDIATGYYRMSMAGRKESWLNGKIMHFTMPANQPENECLSVDNVVYWRVLNPPNLAESRDHVGWVLHDESRCCVITRKRGTRIGVDTVQLYMGKDQKCLFLIEVKSLEFVKTCNQHLEGYHLKFSTPEGELMVFIMGNLSPVSTWNGRGLANTPVVGMGLLHVLRNSDDSTFFLRYPEHC